MIHDAKIDFLLIQKSHLQAFQNDMLQHEPYKTLVSAIAALDQCSNEYRIVIQVTSVPTGSDGATRNQPEVFTSPLTRRELEVYRLAIEGLSNKVIAEKLFITVETVRSHRKSIVSKAGARNIEEIKNRILKANNLLKY